MPFHFNIAREDLLQAIAAHQNITNKKGNMAILANVLMEVANNEIVFTGTDLEIGLKKSVPAEVFETGVLTVPSKKLFELARESASNIITFKEEDKNWIDITAGSSNYKLAGMTNDEFPQFPAYNEDTMVQVDANVIGELVDKTIFSIAVDKENMYTLTAALFQKIEENDKTMLRMITSDGHRLSIMSKESEGAALLEFNKLTLIPRRGIQEIRKFTEEKDTLMIGIEEKQIVLKSDDSLLIIRLMEGEFPNFESIINVISMDNTILINKRLFTESLKRINLFTEDIFHAIKFELTNDKLILTSQNADFGSARDEIPVKYNGDPISIGFNCRYFIDALQIMEGEFIEASINSDNSPCLITSEEDEGFLGIIMPMKI